jgi:CRP/FNR family transcriptional regulator
MFCNLDDKALDEFSALGIRKEFASGATLFAEGAPVGSVFVVCHGRVKLYTISKEGRTLILKIAFPGDVLGLSAVMSGQRYEVSAETVESTEFKAIPREDFLTFIQKYGQASVHAAQALSAEYRTAFFDARRLALSTSVASRLASLLLEWGRAAAHDRPDMRFTMALTHEDLSSLIGTSRETVTRILSQFKRDKLIQMRGATIVLLAPDKLERLVA